MIPKPWSTPEKPIIPPMPATVKRKVSVKIDPLTGRVTTEGKTEIK